MDVDVEMHGLGPEQSTILFSQSLPPATSIADSELMMVTELAVAVE
jgi:hypothetical protein